jgi:hypothetical protein
VSKKRDHPLLSQVQAKDDLAQVLDTPEGRRVLWRIISGCNVWGRNPAATINLAAQLHEGMRVVGIELMEAIDAVDRSLIPLMMQDAANAEILNERD